MQQESKSHKKPVGTPAVAFSALTVVVALGLYLLITSVFYPLGFLSVFDAKRILQLGLFVALLSIPLVHVPLRRATFRQLGRVSKFVGAAIIALFVIGIASSLRLAHPAYALLDVTMILVMILMIFVTAGSRDLSAQLFDRWAVVLLAAMGFAVVVQELMGFVVGWTLGTEFSYEQVLIHFANPRFYNQLQTWSIPVLAAIPLLFPTRRWVKSTCIVLLGLQWFLVFSTGARGTFISLFAAMVIIALWLPVSRVYWLKLQIAGVMAGIVFYVGIVFLNDMFIPEPGDFYIHSVGRSMIDTSGRSTLWRLSIDEALENPVLGTGPTRFACDSELLLPAHPHSFPFRIMGEWGVIALLLLVMLAVVIGIRLLVNIKHKDTSRRAANRPNYPEPTPAFDRSDLHLKAILATSVIAGAMHACLSGLLIMPASQVAMIMMAGWTLSLTASAEQPSPPSFRYPSVYVSLLFAGLLIACAQLAFAVRELPRLSERAGYSEQVVRLVPRFWWTGRACDYRYPQGIK